MGRTVISFELIGAGGDAVDFARTISGHGLTWLAPHVVDEVSQTLTVTLPVAQRIPRTVTVSSPFPAVGAIQVHGEDPDDREAEQILAAVRWILRLDADLSPFYAMASADPELAWVTGGAGRMTRSLTVFEDTVKTICTTNCAWSATVRMTNALVLGLGEPGCEARPDHWANRAFPTPLAMAEASEEFYRGTVRCGYRAGYLRSLARSVVDGTAELEWLARASCTELSDDDLAKRLVALPGVGPYAAAHIMMMLGRYSHLILDSWTRPTYARRIGKEAVSDAEIRTRFAGYGEYAGLAFWMSLSDP